MALGEPVARGIVKANSGMKGRQHTVSPTAIPTGPNRTAPTSRGTPSGTCRMGVLPIGLQRPWTRTTSRKAAKSIATGRSAAPAGTPANRTSAIMGATMAVRRERQFQGKFTRISAKRSANFTPTAAEPSGVDRASTLSANLVTPSAPDRRA